MKDDYSDAIFSCGLVCYNTNNRTTCIVLDGHMGNEKDRASLVLETAHDGRILLHTPPNRALKPTGGIAIYQLQKLKEALNRYVPDLAEVRGSYEKEGDSK